jgi:hypothetical protein
LFCFAILLLITHNKHKIALFFALNLNFSFYCFIITKQLNILLLIMANIIKFLLFDVDFRFYSKKIVSVVSVVVVVAIISFYDIFNVISCYYFIYFVDTLFYVIIELLLC